MQHDKSKHEISEIRGTSVVILLVSFWLVTSPFILSHGSAAVTWNQVIFGIIIGLLAVIRYRLISTALTSQLIVLTGVWIAIAPLVINAGATAILWSSTISGLIILILSLTLDNDRLQTRHSSG
ncbi:MAG: SPW repeat protein [Candidatus Saccharimonadales bacterium]